MTQRITQTDWRYIPPEDFQRMFGLIRQGNRTDDPEAIAQAFEFTLKLGLTYAEGFQLFQAADPQIDKDRYEELAQIADDESSKR